MKFLFALDSFKGCLSSHEACSAAAAGILPSDSATCMPVSDGGEGISSILTKARHGRLFHAPSHDPLFRPISAPFGLSRDRSTAFIEVAAASGLALLAPNERDPLSTTSYGTGELIRAALNHGASTIILGLGGSATNDAGLGLLQALGFTLFNAKNKPLPPGATGIDLLRVTSILPPTQPLPPFSLIAPCDVQAPLYGPHGAAHVFAPQKGATPIQVTILENGLHRIASLWPTHIASTPGAGAAGGIGAGILACLHAHLTPGIDYVLDAIDLDKALTSVDWVITGEGHSDSQTLLGKVPSGIATRAHRAGIPVALLSGGISDLPSLQDSFDYVASINPPNLPLSLALLPHVARANLTIATHHFLQTIRP